MIYTIPHYFKKFSCTASKCQDTCCAGWAIMIDRKSLERYRHMEGPFGSRLHNSINWEDSSFHQYNGRCAFLNEDNLCDIYAETGAENLCRTCRTYPRHIEEFEGCREVSLCMSCMEAAKLILGCEEPVSFLTKEDEKEESYEEFDFFLYTKLMDARELALNMLQERSLTMRQRMAMCLALAHDLQGRIRRDRLYEADALFNRYRGEKRNPYFAGRLGPMDISAQKRYQTMMEMFGIFHEMEVLNQGWPDFALSAGLILYGSGQEAYVKQREGFIKDTGERLEVWREQLMVYFVFTYFCGAVYDGNPYGKMKLAAAGTLLIEELAQALWAQRDGRFEFMDFVNVAHRFSREVEHSDENKKCLEEALLKRPEFNLERLMGAL